MRPVSYPDKNGTNGPVHKSFLANAIDVTKEYGLKAAATGFMIGSVLMAHKFFVGADPLLLRNILAPAALVTGCVAGFMGYERTNNTCSMIGSALLTASFAGTDGDGFSPVLCAVNSLGIVTMGLGSHLMPKKKKQREETGDLKHIAQDGKTLAASSQIVGNAILLMGAMLGNKADMIAPFACWTAASVTKATRAGLIARDKIRQHNLE